VHALLHTAIEYGYDAKLLQASLDVNARQRQIIIHKLQEKLRILKGRTVGLLGSPSGRIQTTFATRRACRSRSGCGRSARGCEPTPRWRWRADHHFPENAARAHAVGCSTVLDFKAFGERAASWRSG
jgi:hypothetical protein